MRHLDGVVVSRMVPSPSQGGLRRGAGLRPSAAAIFAAALLPSVRAAPVMGLPRLLAGRSRDYQPPVDACDSLSVGQQVVIMGVIGMDIPCWSSLEGRATRRTVPTNDGSCTGTERIGRVSPSGRRCAVCVLVGGGVRIAAVSCVPRRTTRYRVRDEARPSVLTSHGRSVCSTHQVTCGSPSDDRYGVRGRCPGLMGPGRTITWS
jgi:hypothetical protein